MYNHSEKKQVQYSLEHLSRGLFYHLKFKKYEEITVTDICRRAQISRRTFYRNCASKEDLVLYSTDQLVFELLELEDLRMTDSVHLYTDFFRYWEKHKAFLDILFRNALFDMFLNEFIAVCNNALRYPLQEKSLEGADDRELSRRYSNAFMIGGLGQMLKAWTEEGFASSVEEIVKSVQFLVPPVPADIAERK